MQSPNGITGTDKKSKISKRRKPMSGNTKNILKIVGFSAAIATFIALYIWATILENNNKRETSEKIKTLELDKHRYRMLVAMESEAADYFNGLWETEVHNNIILEFENEKLQKQIKILTRQNYVLKNKVQALEIDIDDLTFDLNAWREYTDAANRAMPDNPTAPKLESR